MALNLSSIHSRKLLGPVLFLSGVAACFGSLRWTRQISTSLAPAGAPAEARSYQNIASDFSGQTQPVPGRSATIAPAVLHPVDDVLVKPGDRVKKGQVLLKLDDDEPQADARAKRATLAEMKAGLARFKAQPREEERAEARALLETTRISLKEARRSMERLQGLWDSGAVSEKIFFESLANRSRLEADERAGMARLERLLKQPINQEIAEMESKIAGAKANLEVALAELEHYTIQAPQGGVVARLEVNRGMVSRPGTTSWGEIVDLREIDVRSDLTPEQAVKLKVGQAADVYMKGASDSPWHGSIVLVGWAADQDGRIPVLVRVPNPQEILRLNVKVNVRFLR
jgi:multidrug resistance efflux pump